MRRAVTASELRCCCGHGPHPPLRRGLCRSLWAAKDPRVPASVRRRGSGRRRVSCMHSTDDDIVATYREHGHALVRGMTARSIMAEMFGKQEGCCRGRGGSMHLFDAATRFYGGNAIVGGGLPLAVGLALADKNAVPTACDGVLLRRRCRSRRSVPRIPQSRGPVEVARAVHLREQSVRHGHGARASRNRRPIFGARRLRTPWSGEVDGMDVLAVRLPCCERRHRAFAPATARTFSNC